MRKFDSITKGQIVANIILGIMMILTFASVMLDSSGKFGLSSNQRAQVNEICIEGDWDECHDFGERAVIEISQEADPIGNGEVILRIRKVK